MLTPYEIIVKTALPALRSMIAKELTEKYKLKQREIADLMHVTQAAVSYYLTKARGKYTRQLYNTEVRDMISELTEKIYVEKPTPEELVQDLNRIIVHIIRKGYLCEYHSILESIPSKEECNVCEEILKYWDVT